MLAVPGWSYAQFAEILAPIHAQRCAEVTREVIGEARRTRAWSGLTIHAARRNKPQRAASTSKYSRRSDGASSLSDADHAILQGLDLPKPGIDDQLAFL